MSMQLYTTVHFLVLLAPSHPSVEPRPCWLHPPTIQHSLHHSRCTISEQRPKTNSHKLVLSSV